MTNIAVIGLGSMGFGSACCLVRAGFTTYGVDIRDTGIGRFCHRWGGLPRVMDTMRLKNSQIVFVYLVSSADVKTVMLGENGYALSAKKGTIFVLCATMPAPRYYRHCQCVAPYGYAGT